jgi:hypothetical protein
MIVDDLATVLLISFIFPLVVGTVGVLVTRIVQDLPPHKVKFYLGFVVGISISIALISLLVWQGTTRWCWFASPEVSFANPRDGSEVASQERVRGESFCISDDARLWLVVYSHEVDRYYPEALPPERDGDEWALPLYIGVEGDAGQRFDIVAVVVDDDADAQLDEYIRSGERSGSYPGWDVLPPGFGEVGRVTVTRENGDAP